MGDLRIIGTPGTDSRPVRDRTGRNIGCLVDENGVYVFRPAVGATASEGLAIRALDASTVLDRIEEEQDHGYPYLPHPQTLAARHAIRVFEAPAGPVWWDAAMALDGVFVGSPHAHVATLLMGTATLLMGTAPFLGRDRVEGNPLDHLVYAEHWIEVYGDERTIAYNGPAEGWRAAVIDHYARRGWTVSVLPDKPLREPEHPAVLTPPGAPMAGDAVDETWDL